MNDLFFNLSIGLGIVVGLHILKILERDIGLERSVWIVYLALAFGGKG